MVENFLICSFTATNKYDMKVDDVYIIRKNEGVFKVLVEDVTEVSCLLHFLDTGGRVRILRKNFESDYTIVEKIKPIMDEYEPSDEVKRAIDKLCTDMGLAPMFRPRNPSRARVKIIVV